MRRKVSFKYPFKVKKWQLFLGIVCSIGFIVSIIVGLNTINEKKEVSAHPSNTIALDEGGANEFEVPRDAQNLLEPALTAQNPTYEDFVQSESVIPILEKKIVDGSCASDAVSNGIEATIMDIQRTNYGHYFVLYGFSASNRGGLIKVAVFKENGDLIAENIIGDLSNLNLRVNNGFYYVDNNSFLVGTHNGSFYRYVVSGETENTAVITRTQLSVPNNPNNNMKVDYHKSVYNYGRYSSDTTILGRVSPNRTEFEGIVKGRIPVSTLDISGWETTGFSGNSTNSFSLENLRNTDPEMGLRVNGESISAREVIYDLNGKIYGVFNNMEYDGVTIVNKRSFQIFDANSDVIDNDTSQLIKERKYSFVSEKEVIMLKEICNDEMAYYMVDTDDTTDLVEVDLSDYSSRILKSYPQNTRLRLILNSDNTISYFGSTTELEDDFFSDYYTGKISGTNYFISGIMRNVSHANPLEVISLRAFVTDGKVLPNAVLSNENNALFIGGETDDINIFVDNTKFYTKGTETPSDAGTPSGTTAFVGVMEINDDYAPIVNKESSIKIDITDTAVTSPVDTAYRGWNSLDRWLITGAKGGVMTGEGSDKALKVYDHFDSNDPLIEGTAAARAEWLQKRINRNPKDIDADIEWDKLGFDPTTTGPQLVTYFVTDTQSQPSVTSRWVNKKTPQTIEEDEYALDAQNFHIPLTGIDTAIPDATKFKELAKTMAWNMDDGTIEEDGTDSSKLSDKVTVDTDQLKALREGTVAKPYPVDVTYKPEDGVTIKNRVWVFVTTKNTLPNNESIYTEVTPDETNGIVYYADDYSIPFRSRHTHDADDVLEMGNVRVYDYYDSDHETSEELPVLADKDSHPEKLQVIHLDQITGAMNPGTIEYGVTAPKVPLIQYDWDGDVSGYHQSGEDHPTFGGLDVTLTGDVLLHVRQVILDESDKLVFPTEGYLNVRSVANTNPEDPIEVIEQLRQTKIPSQNNTDALSFETFAVELEHLENDFDLLVFDIVLPEFYEIYGNYLTFGVHDPNGESHFEMAEDTIRPDSNPPFMDKGFLIGEEEFYITIYLKPKLPEKGPQPYSWDYKVNDFGNIKTK